MRSSPNALKKAIGRIDARNWAARPDRVQALRSALSGSKGVIRKALSETAGFDMSPQTLPGPTGESNRLRMYPKGTVLCLGPTPEIATAQAVQALAAGCGVLMVVPGAEAAAKPLQAPGPRSWRWTARWRPRRSRPWTASRWSAPRVPRTGRSGCASRCRSATGAILPLVTETVAPERFVLERHLCIDTTAAGGNASLLATAS